ncbi:MAG: bacteriohemerythrin [Clostridiales bacterium]|nr:bacteriohemerythrin [Clostridiales bacterium]
MANQIKWEERFNIGVDIIDKEHKKLFKIINKLFAFEEDEAKEQWVCQEGIKYFKDHALGHFKDEEEYMKSINYPGLEVHKRIHTDFRQKILPALEQELKDTKFSSESVNHFLGVCVGWLVAHTLSEDQAITGKSMNRWGDLLPEEQHDAMKDTIVQLVYDIFRLDTQVISESYGGEKFGNGVYYRLIHGNDKGERCETILVLEDRLLINTTGKMLGEKTNKLSIMTINAARYTARQIVNRVMEHFPPVDSFELKSENLLTYEQFQKVLHREKPQISLLCNTGEGYFAYCAIAPYLHNSSKAGADIKAQNAMVEIKKYLEKTKTKNKKKILVVDDSSVIRESMSKLLGKDYDVASAESGMSAIRSIILDRPDLILLDYEMPVCDGKQVLEMIRAEKAMADIPVIFLTGRGDAESVKNVMALKPAGYLLKTMKPDDVKNVIDGYFDSVEKSRKSVG